MANKLTTKTEDDITNLSPERHAQNFAAVRDAHRLEIVEDYVELIAELGRVQGDVRSGHLAERFGVSHATVTNRIQRLVTDGLIEDRPYQPLVLTSKGQEIAKASRERHLLVRTVLMTLGVDLETAEADAEGIEHHVSEVTLAAFARFIADLPK